MLSPETVAAINTVVTSLPFAISLYLVFRRMGRTLVQMYSLAYLTPFLVVVYGVSVPVPGNLYAYFTGAPVLLMYGVTDAAVLAYAVGSALAVVFVGVDQWADVLYSGSLTVMWLLSAIKDLSPRDSLLLGSAITVASNMLVALYKYHAWPIIPLPSVILQFSVAVGAITALEGLAWWVFRKLKPPARQPSPS